MPNELIRFYQRYKGAIVKIAVTNSDGDKCTGTGFHIGDGIIVTAKHNLEDHTLEGITRETNVSSPVQILRQLHHFETDIDVLLCQTDIERTAPRIPLGTHLNEWLHDEFLLTKALIMGYPRIPFANKMFLVCAEAEVNATIELYNSRTPHFILSSTARGGFSGGPAITDDGQLLGVITQSLMSSNEHETTGFCAAISVQPIFEILTQLGDRPSYIPSDLWRRLKGE